jgi:uncharacterized protein (TIGR03067 family)
LSTHHLSIAARLVLAILIPLAAPLTDSTHAADPRPTVIDPRNREDSDRLQGRWQIVSVAIDGNKLTEKQIAAEAIDDLRIHGDRFSPTRRDGENSLWHGHFRIDATQSPKQLTLYDQESNGRTMVFRGIYTIERNTLTLCLNRDGADPTRPDVFETKPGSPLVIFTFKRKPAE